MVGSLKMIIHHNAFPRIVFNACGFQPHTLNVRRAAHSYQDLINGYCLIFTTALKVDEFFPILLLDSLDLGFKYQVNAVTNEGFLYDLGGIAVLSHEYVRTPIYYGNFAP